MQQLPSSPNVKPHLTFLSDSKSVALQIALTRANAALEGCDHTEWTNEAGTFALTGALPADFKPSLNDSAIGFSIKANNDGAIFEVNEVSKNASYAFTIFNNDIPNRTLAIFLNAWADEQLEKTQPVLFT